MHIEMFTYLDMYLIIWMFIRAFLDGLSLSMFVYIF